MRMDFPDWVRTGDEREPVNRVFYIVHHLSNRLKKGACVSDLCEAVGVSRRALYWSMNRGRFSASVAVAIEKKFGRDVVTHEALMSPMSIEAISQ